MNKRRRHRIKKSNREIRRMQTILSLCLPVVILLLFGGYKLVTEGDLSHRDGVIETAGRTCTAAVVLEDGTVIPECTRLDFSASTTRQMVYFLNPESNVCYFRIRLELSDGTLLWQSANLQPGFAINRISLRHRLSPGEYSNAILHYDCYALSGGDILNSAEVPLTVFVI